MSIHDIKSIIGNIGITPDKKTASNNNNNNFSNLLLKNTTQINNTSTVNNINVTSPLLALQEISTTQYLNRQMAIKHGRSIIKKLKRLKIDILLGNIDSKELEDLWDECEKFSYNDDDEGVLNIMTQIESLAIVTYAKLNKKQE